MTLQQALDREDRIAYNLLNHDDKEAVHMVFDALREQECVPDATKTSGEPVTNRNGLNCLESDAINLVEFDTVKWISVKDMLPDKSGYYLYFAKNPCRGLQDGIGVSYFMHKAQEWKKVYTPCVTHWMPFPLKPPKEEV